MPLTDDIRGFYDGAIHGGILATLADAACASALWGTYDFGPQFTVTTDMHVRYYRQPKGGPLIAEAKMVHKGKRLMSAECTVADAAGRVLIRTTAHVHDRRRAAKRCGTSRHRLTTLRPSQSARTAVEVSPLMS